MIRSATPDDLGSIVKIYNKVRLDRKKLGNIRYETELQKNGFLLGIDTPEKILEEIKETYDFLVEEKNGKISGYLVANHRDHQKFYDDEYKTWFDLELKDFYYNNPKGMTIATLAVDPSFTGKGVATKLLKFLEENLKKEDFKYLFSIVTLAPITNCPTIIWHTKNGFRRFAMGRPRRLFDLDNYSGVLFYKKL